MKNILNILLLLSTCHSLSFSAIKLPAFFADHMVLQRDKPIIIYGYALYEDSIIINLDGIEQIAEVDKFGFFESVFPARSASIEPIVLTIKGSQKIEINNVLIGDVFIVGGQSNMEWPMSLINNAQKEIENANFDHIRLFTVPKSIKSAPSYNMDGDGWKIANSNSVKDFSAIGFLVARQIHLDKNIPIGIIDNAWGGTNIAGWMPEEAFANMAEYENKIKEFKQKHKNDLNIEAIREDWLSGLGMADKGIHQAWWQVEYSKNAWKEIAVPGLWEGQGYANKDGIFWYSKDFDLKDLPSIECTLNLGQIDDSDITYLNGFTIGSKENAYNVSRKYSVGNNVLLKGKNHLVIRVTDTGGGGGINGIADSIHCKCGEEIIPLSGTWKIAEGTEGYPEISDTYEANAYPTNRYNEMVHPLTGLAAKAYLYYQGESDVHIAKEYAELLKRMILTYRTNFGDQKLPFVIIQLANFMKEDTIPVESNWAELRQSQSSVTKLPYTGMVCTIDVGDANDIHPRDKQTVAKRTTSVIKRLAYNEQNIYDGPKIEKVTKNNFGILISFANIGDGLSIKGDANNINGFVIKTNDGKLHPVKAKKQSKTSILIEYKEGITHLRYLWANNPGTIQIYNSEDFPAEPFEYKF
jgi:sialate O-acetylesterase